MLRLMIFFAFIVPVQHLHDWRNSVTSARTRGGRTGWSDCIRGENIRTGVTAILPHGGNLFREKVPGTVFVGNAFAKLAGSAQVNELGEIETPILLTSELMFHV